MAEEVDVILAVVLLAGSAILLTLVILALWFVLERVGTQKKRRGSEIPRSQTNSAVEEDQMTTFTGRGKGQTTEWPSSYEKHVTSHSYAFPVKGGSLAGSISGMSRTTSNGMNDEQIQSIINKERATSHRSDDFYGTTTSNNSGMVKSNTNQIPYHFTTIYGTTSTGDTVTPNPYQSSKTNTSAITSNFLNGETVKSTSDEVRDVVSTHGTTVSKNLDGDMVKSASNIHQTATTSAVGGEVAGTITNKVDDVTSTLGTRTKAADVVIIEDHSAPYVLSNSSSNTALNGNMVKSTTNAIGSVTSTGVPTTMQNIDDGVIKNTTNAINTNGPVNTLINNNGLDGDMVKSTSNAIATVTTTDVTNGLDHGVIKSTTNVITTKSTTTTLITNTGLDGDMVKSTSNAINTVTTTNGLDGTKSTINAITTNGTADRLVTGTGMEGGVQKSATNVIHTVNNTSAGEVDMVRSSANRINTNATSITNHVYTKRTNLNSTHVVSTAKAVSTNNRYSGSDQQMSIPGSKTGSISSASGVWKYNPTPSDNQSHHSADRRSIATDKSNTTSNRQSYYSSIRSGFSPAVSTAGSADNILVKTKSKKREKLSSRTAPESEEKKVFTFNIS